jgi:hypothetical protein
VKKKKSWDSHIELNVVSNNIKILNFEVINIVPYVVFVSYLSIMIKS